MRIVRRNGILYAGCAGRLAQLVRAPALHAGGYRFESCIAQWSQDAGIVIGTGREWVLTDIISDMIRTMLSWGMVVCVAGVCPVVCGPESAFQDPASLETGSNCGCCSHREAPNEQPGTPTSTEFPCKDTCFCSGLALVHSQSTIKLLDADFCCFIDSCQSTSALLGQIFCLHVIPSSHPPCVERTFPLLI